VASNYKLSDKDHTLCPLQVLILLACWCSPTPQQWFTLPQWNSPAATEYRKRFIERGLLNEKLRCTKLGEELVNRILSVEVPNAGY
jgi:hypothetical protein